VNTTIYVYHGPSSSNGSPDALSYIALGFWSAGHNNNSAQNGPVGVFLLGYETPLSAMPTTGQGSYSGQVFGLVYAPINGHVMEASLEGMANLSADFTSGKIAGAFTGIHYDGGYTDGTANQPAQHVVGPWNDVSINAAIAAGSNRFSGATAVTSAPQNPFSLAGSATGHVDGAFFGPAAQAVGAVWTLSDGTTSAIGGIAAGR